MQNNFAFVDANNVHLGIRSIGWDLDWKRFRVYLEEHYGVSRAYLFIGFLPEHQRLYTRMQNYGYTLVFKPLSYREGGKPKGNVDAALTF